MVKIFVFLHDPSTTLGDRAVSYVFNNILDSLNFARGPAIVYKTGELS